VVHINAAVAGLVGAFMIGKRVGYGRESMAPHSLTFTMIGASLLWFGWFGFNAGSALEASGGCGPGDGQYLGGDGMCGDVLDAGRMDAQGQALDAGCGFRRGCRSGGDHPGGRFRRCGRRHRHRSAGRRRLPVGRQWPEALLGADDSLDVFGVHGVGGILGAS
jgi:Amt family ammonium transporter